MGVLIIKHIEIEGLRWIEHYLLEAQLIAKALGGKVFKASIEEICAMRFACPPHKCFGRRALLA